MCVDHVETARLKAVESLRSSGLLQWLNQVIDNEEYCKLDSYNSFCLRLARHYVNENNHKK